MKQAIILGLAVAMLYVATLATAAPTTSAPTVCAHLLGTTETQCGMPYGNAQFEAGHITEIVNSMSTSVHLRGWAFNGCDYTEVLNTYLNAGKSVQSIVWPPPYQPHSYVYYGWCSNGYTQPSCIGGQLQSWCQP